MTADSLDLLLEDYRGKLKTEKEKMEQLEKLKEDTQRNIDRLEGAVIGATEAQSKVRAVEEQNAQCEVVSQVEEAGE